MLKPGDVNRATLAQWKVIANHYAKQGGPHKEIVDAARYAASVYATDLNGDGCRFPSCDCVLADCAAQPGTPLPVVWPRQAPSG